MMDVSEIFTALTKSVIEAAEAIQQMAESMKGTAEKQIALHKNLIVVVPPRRIASRARSLFLRRHWINYRARDKLPCISLKSGGKRKCQKK